LDKSKTVIEYNSKWLKDLGIDGLLKLAAKTTVAQMLERDDFEKRYESDKPISIVEFLYPLLQAYDSVALKADIELGGNDQKFNLLLGREIQKDYSLAPQVILTMPLLEGTDGIKKMSKSYNNYIGLNEEPKEMFGKIMSVSDEIMYRYYELLTQEDLKIIREMHPKEAKVSLAFELTKRYWGEKEAQNAKEGFAKVFVRKDIPDIIEEFKVIAGNMQISELLLKTGLTSSKNAARRLIEQGGIKIDGHKVEADENILIKDSFILQAGKRKFVKIILDN
jgi:tyrosyl-tRNA synthetase